MEATAPEDPGGIGVSSMGLLGKGEKWERSNVKIIKRFDQLIKIRTRGLVLLWFTEVSLSPVFASRKEKFHVFVGL